MTEENKEDSLTDEEILKALLGLVSELRDIHAEMQALQAETAKTQLELAKVQAAHIALVEQMQAERACLSAELERE